MLKFIRVWGENFLCFERFELNLNRTTRTLILGDNSTTPGCDSNMSGKTGLLDSITWCLYGQTSKGEKGDAVVNRAIGKNCVVGLDLELNGIAFIVVRYRKHKQFGDTLVIQDASGKDMFQAIGTKEPQVFLENLLGIDYVAFTNSVLFPQEIREFFVSSSDASQKKVLDTILGLYILTEAEEKVKERIRQNDDQRRLLNLEKLRLETLITNNSAVLEELYVKREEAEKATQMQLEAIQASMDTLEPSRAGLIAEKDRINSSITLLETQLVDDRIKELNDEYMKLVNEIKLAEINKASISQDIKRLSDSTSNKLLQTVSCWVCGQDISPEQKEGIKHELELAEAALNINYSGYESIITAKTLERDEVVKQINELQVSNNAITLQLNNLGDELNQVAFNEYKLNTDLNSLRSQKAQIDNNTCAYADMIEAKQAAINNDRGLLEGVAVSLAEADHKDRMLQFWLKGFGKAGLRSFLLDVIVPMFNEAADHYASVLTEGGATLRASTTTQIKTKESREKFNVSVIENGLAVDFKQYSGGYKKRLALAGALALQSILKYRTSNAISLFIADEPAENLDATGVEKLMVVFDMLEREGVSVFVISHDDKYRSYFSNIVTVERKDGKSSVHI